MKNDEKLVLILEDANIPLTCKKDSDDDIILEGVFAKFGELNNNNRIYEEDEYFPHLKRLQEKIQKNNLLGELDHPDRLEISLSKVSHKIESIEYDKNTRTIRGRLRLLNTPQGEIAKKLVESGVTLSISSRAVGIVKPDKKVKIQMLQTYDLVADPGFKEAGLKKINESLGIYDDNIAIYDITDENPEFIESIKNDFTSNKNNNNMSNYVTEEELNNYTLLLKEDFDKITKRLKNLENNINENNQYNNIDRLEEKINILEQSLNKNLKENKKLNELKDYVIYLSKELDNSIKYTSYVKDVVNESLNDNQVDQQLKNIMAYCNYLKECLEQNTNYTEYIKDHINEYINITDENKSDIKNLEKSTNNIINYSNYLKENIETEINTIIAYSEYLKKNLNENILYSEYVAESVNNQLSNDDFIINKKYNNKLEKNNSNILNIDENLSEQGTEIVNRIDKLLEEVKSKKIDDLTNINKETKNNENSNKHRPWQDFLSSDLKKIWDNLDDELKNTIEARSKFYDINNSYNVKNFWDIYVSPLIDNNSKDKSKDDSSQDKSKNDNKKSNLNEIENNDIDSDESCEKWISFLSDDKKDIWEDLSDDVKKPIIAKCKYYDLSDEKKALAFWNKYVVPALKSKKLSVNINESKNYQKNKTNDNQNGYSTEYINNVKKILNKQNKF